MSEQTHKVLTSSKDPNWRTPSDLAKALVKEFDCVIDFAATFQDKVCHMWAGPGSILGEDALTLNWNYLLAVQGNGSGFLNPPFSQGKPIDPWVKKAALTGCVLNQTMVGVIPYSPQTKWWRTYIMGQNAWARVEDQTFILRATEVRLFPYRLKFDPPEGHTGSVSGANVNTAIVIWKSTKGFIEPWTPAFKYWDYK